MKNITLKSHHESRLYPREAMNKSMDQFILIRSCPLNIKKKTTLYLRMSNLHIFAL